MYDVSTSILPHPSEADEQGLVVTTETMTSTLLIDAYSHGLFPWSDSPVRWYSPDPRAIFLLDRTSPPKKMGKLMRRHGLKVTLDREFASVISACADAHRDEGEWISEAFEKAYSELHKEGYAHSIEVWQDNILVGGLYGVQVGAMFAGESMFHHVSGASKLAFSALLHLTAKLGILFIDAQVINMHTHSLGAVLIKRQEYLLLLSIAVGRISSTCKWDNSLLETWQP